MERNPNPDSAFFNLRFSIGLAAFLAGVSLALIGFSRFSSASAQVNGMPTRRIVSANLPAGLGAAVKRALARDTASPSTDAGTKLTAGDGTGGDYFGAAVSLDGSAELIDAPEADVNGN